MRERFWLWLMRFTYRRLGPGGLLPDGVPGLRSAEHPCTTYAPRRARWSDGLRLCHGDGHYLCRECAFFAGSEVVDA